jgi:hypothetical protein
MVGNRFLSFIMLEKAIISPNSAFHLGGNYLEMIHYTAFRYIIQIIMRSGENLKSFTDDEIHFKTLKRYL